jgi:hypothetical protein
MKKLLLLILVFCCFTASAQSWTTIDGRQRFVTALGIPTKDTASGLAADSSQILIRPADSSLYIKYKRTWLKVGGSSGTPAGSNTQIQYNNSGAFGASAGFIWNNSTQNLAIGSGTAPAYITILANNTSSGWGGRIVADNPTGLFLFQHRNNSATYVNCWYLNANSGIGATYFLDRVFVTNNPGNSAVFIVNSTTDNGVDKLQVNGSAAISSDVTIGPYQTGASGVSLTPGRNYSFGEGSGTSYVNLFRQANSAAAILGYGYKFSSTANGFASSLGGSFTKSAISVGGDIKFYADNPTNVANGTDITPTQRMSITPSGVTATGTLTAATIVKSGGTSSQYLMADGSTSLGAGASISGTTNYVPKFTSSSAIGNSQIIDNGTNLSLRTTASTYPVNINLGANSGIGFFEDGTRATIIGTNQNINSTAPLQFQATQFLFTNGKITLNTASDNGVDHLQVNGSISGIGFKQNYVTKTGAYTATNADYVIDCTSGTFTVTLPASSGRTGRILIIKNSGAGVITVDGNASETIDGAATYSLAVQYATVQIMSDGTNWKIISKF